MTTPKPWATSTIFSSSFNLMQCFQTSGHEPMLSWDSENQH